MGLDAVELVLRTEDLFAISFTDHEAAAIRTVGDFYVVLCAKLDVTPLASPITSPELPVITQKEKTFLFLAKYTPLPYPPELLPGPRNPSGTPLSPSSSTSNNSNPRKFSTPPA